MSSLTRVEIGAVELTHGHEVAAAACGATAEAAASGAATTATTTAAILIRLRRHWKMGTRTGDSSPRDLNPCSSGRHAILAADRGRRTAARKCLLYLVPVCTGHAITTKPGCQWPGPMLTVH